MTTKLSQLTLLPVLVVMSACASSPELSNDEDNLGRTRDALCISAPGPRPTPDAYVPGPENPIVSESYGSGPCDGFAVQFTGVQGAGYRVTVVASPQPSSAVACNATTIRYWVWHRVTGGEWTYAGARTTPARWFPGCLSTSGFDFDAPTGTYDVLVKAQGRTETNGYAYNRSVKIVAREAWNPSP